MKHRNANDLSRERFGQFAESYVSSQTHAQGADLERLAALAGGQEHERALDIATGGGHTALRMTPLAGRVMATDITPQMLTAARQFLTSQGAHNVTFLAADAEALPFADATYDLVTCRIAPHHFPHCPRFVEESARVLQPGGLLLVQDHLLPEDDAAAQYIETFERLRDPSHHCAYAASEWMAMFEGADLKVEGVEEVIKEHVFLPWAGRQDCSEETINRLTTMAQEAPPAVAEWMRPRGFGTPEAAFIGHHLIIAGRKGAM
ncbi:MAG: class I SAM-dependent methyltransferase [Anaerolineae bacterium]